MFFNFSYFFFLTQFFSSCLLSGFSPTSDNCLSASLMLQNHSQPYGKLTAYFVLFLLSLLLLQCLTIWDFHVVQRAWLVPILISWVMKMLLIIHQAPWSMPSHYARFWSLKALALKLTSEIPVIQEDNAIREHVTEKCVVTQVLPCREVVKEQSAKH